MPKFEAVTKPPRILICGEPAAGKTGALAQLANAGYRLMIHDFDSNSRVIGSYLRPNAADVYINTYAVAKITNTNLFAGTGTATKQAVDTMRQFCKMLEHWKTPTEDLGPTAKMTSKDVIVIDSGTFLGELLLLAAHEDPETKRDLRSLYNVAGRYYGAILDHLTGAQIGASVLVLTHIMQTGDKDDQGKIVGKSRDIPVGVGEKFSKKMQTYFSDIWHLEVGRDGKRSFKTGATDKVSLRTSAPHIIKGVEDFDLASMLNRLTDGSN
jgi:hypothetical protein